MTGGAARVARLWRLSQAIEAKAQSMEGTGIAAPDLRRLSVELGEQASDVEHAKAAQAGGTDFLRLPRTR